MFDALQYSYIQHALIAGSLVALMGAVVGYFLVLRGLTFAGHAMSHIGFAGAAGAVLLGLPPVAGLLVFTLGAALGIGSFESTLRQRDIVIGIIMMVMLGVGVMCLSLYNGFAERVFNILFGQILGISQSDIIITACSTLFVLAGIFCIFRPLLFSSIDPDVAMARGVPVKALALFFLLLVALTVSMSVQFVGVLLIFTLLVGPAATAMLLFRRALLALSGAILLGVLYVWLGVLLAANGAWPVSFYISALSFGVYVPVRFLRPVFQKLRTLTRQRHLAVCALPSAQGVPLQEGMLQENRPPLR